MKKGRSPWFESFTFEVNGTFGEKLKMIHRYFFIFIKVGHENFVKFVDFNEVVRLKSFKNAVCNKAEYIHI